MGGSGAAALSAPLRVGIIARFVAEHKPPARLPRIQQPIQLLRLDNLRYVQPPGLLGGFHGDGLQPRQLHMVGIGAPGLRQANPPHAQFGGLLDGELQRPALDHRQHQLQVRPRHLRSNLRHRLQQAGAFGHLGQAHAPFPVAAIEGQDFTAHGQAHHLGQVAELVLARAQRLAGLQIAIDKQADHGAFLDRTRSIRDGKQQVASQRTHEPLRRRL